MKNILLLFFLFVYVNAKTDEEVKAEFIKYVMKCTKEHPVEMSELLQLQKFVTPKKTEVKCLLACAYKAEGTMTQNGLYDKEHAYKIVELSKNGDDDREKNGRILADTCASVNDAEVSDGEKGCDRAGLIFKCVTENAPKLGFKI